MRKCKYKNRGGDFAMKKGFYIGIAGVFCLFLVAGCGSREKKNIVGATGGAVVSTDSAAKVLTTDALDALKAVSKTSSATANGPTRVPGLTAAQRLASPALASTWQKPQKDADGYYIEKYTDPEDGTIFDVRVKPNPDWWSLWDNNSNPKMPWDGLDDGADFTSTFDVKGTFDGPSNSGSFTDSSNEIRKVKTYKGIDLYGNVIWTWKGLDWNNTIRTHKSEGTVTRKSDNTWVKMKSTGTSTQSDDTKWVNESPTAGTMTMSETQTMTFTLSSGYTGVFNMKVAGTIWHSADWTSQRQSVKGEIDGSISLSGTEMVKLHLEGRGKENGDGPDMSTIQAYYTSKDDGFVKKTPLTTTQIESIMKMVFGMGGEGKH